MWKNADVLCPGVKAQLKNDNVNIHRKPAGDLWFSLDIKCM